MNDTQRQLIHRYRDGTLTDPAELEALETLLWDSREARDRLRSWAVVDEGLTELAFRPAPVAAPTPSTRQLPLLPIWAGIAALFVLASGITALVWPRGEDSGVGGVARLEFVSEDAAFGADHQLPRESGSALGKGWVRLERGQARIVFHSGAIVELDGPAAFGIDTPMRSYLEYGRVRVHAPESARDFVVATEGMEVVDLGTRFELAVDVDSRESDVSVSEGLVDLHLGSRGTARRIQPLEAGYTARVDAAGEIVVLEQLQDARPTEAAGILGHWTFDSVGEGGSVADVSSGGMDGRLRDSAPVSGVAGQALDLGERGFIDLSEHAGRFGEAEDFTVSAWVRDPSDRIGIIFSISDGTENHRVQFHLNRRHVVFGWQNGLHYDSVSGKVDGWEPGRWYHVAVRSRDRLIWLYRDGEQIGSASLGEKIGTRILSLATVGKPTEAYLGKLSDAGGEAARTQWFGGIIDDVQIYSSALNHRGIRYLYEHPGEAWKTPH